MNSLALGIFLFVGPRFSLSGYWRSNLPALNPVRYGFDDWTFGPSQTYKHGWWTEGGEEGLESGKYTLEGSVLKTSPARTIIRRRDGTLDSIQDLSTTLTIKWIDSKHLHVVESNLKTPLTFTRNYP